jgi:alpha-ribazole phosphatase
MKDANDTIMTRVNLLRHGEHALGQAICGVTDPELSKKGWGQLSDQFDSLLGRVKPNQAKKSQDEQNQAKHSHGGQWDICVSSPRIRCAAFGSHISQQLNIELVITDALAEIDFGEWEGLTGVQVEVSYPGLWQQWLDNPNDPAPHGGEAYGLFQQRILDGWSQLISQYQGKRILLLSHSGVMRVILASVMGLDSNGLFRFNVPHACHSQVSVYHLSDKHGQCKPDWFQLDQHNSNCS